MKEVDRIVALLEDESLEKRIAAAIVLGEIKAKGPEVTDGLMSLALSEVPAVQRHALEALAKVGPKRVVSKIFPLLGRGSDEVRRAAARAIASVGEEIVPVIRTRLATAEGDERRALDSILADLGGKDAFTALLSSLTAGDGNSAKAAAIAVRQQVKSADARQRKSYLAETERFLKQQKKAQGSAETVAAAIKILGYLEDEKATEVLLEYAGDDQQPPLVRQEAIIALRFALTNKSQAPAVVPALIDAAAATDRTLAQTALHTLGSLTLSATHAKRLEKLLHHPEIERARFVIEQLGRQKGADAAKLLVQVIATQEKRRAELAAAALAGNEDAIPLLAKALLEAEDADRAWMLKKVLHPVARKIPAAIRKQILGAAVERLAEREAGWEALLEVARDADSEAAGEALRELAAKLKRGKDKNKAIPVLTVLARSGLAAPEDTYTLAAIELAKSTKDVRPTARSGDDALKLLNGLVTRGFDVAGALRKDKSLGLEDLYYAGFHFAEEGHPIGNTLLEEVVKKGGRTKLAKMAKNKLSLAEA